MNESISVGRDCLPSAGSPVTTGTPVAVYAAGKGPNAGDQGTPMVRVHPLVHPIQFSPRPKRESFITYPTPIRFLMALAFFVGFVALFYMFAFPTVINGFFSGILARMFYKAMQ